MSGVYYGIDLWSTRHGSINIAVTPHCFMFGIAASDGYRGIHIGPFFIGWASDFV